MTWTNIEPLFNGTQVHICYTEADSRIQTVEPYKNKRTNKIDSVLLFKRTQVYKGTQRILVAYT